MLTKIKSSYILKQIFSNLDNKKKFKIIIYNKYLNNKLDVEIIDYLRLSEKYKIVEKIGFGKEYCFYFDTLIFEGEYLNGKRNGKGKEYLPSISDDKRILFEGEYLNGKRNGKGKEYYYYPKTIKFEGEYLNGKRHGKGKEYNYKGNIKFEGEYFNNKEWTGKGYDEDGNIIYEINKGKGFIKIYNYKSIEFEGEYLNGEKNGKGKEYYYDGNIKFEGEYLNNLRWTGKQFGMNNNIISFLKNGTGKIKEFLYSYNWFEGEYLNGKKNGKGKEYNDNNQLIFEGEYLNGERNGKGIEYDYDNDIKSEYEYLNGFLNGDAKMYKNGHLIFEGKYFNNYKKEGKEYYMNGKLEYEGEYLFDNKWNGKGYDEKGSLIYELKKGNGNVKEYELTLGILIYEGEYINSKRHGKGKEYHNNGKIKFEGEYLKGREWTGKGYNEDEVIIYEINQGKGYLKEFYQNDEKKQLKFEGEYSYGRKNGIGKEYNIFGKLIFEGEYSKNIRNGKGKEYYPNGKINFEGEYLNGEKNGKGNEYYSNGKLKFEGEYLNNLKWTGKGYDTKGNLAYEIKNGNGYVKEYVIEYSEEYLNYEGDYLNGIKNGKGIEYHNNGNKFIIGEYVNGELNGMAKIYDFYGYIKFEGEFKNGRKNGIGREYNKEGNIISEREYFDEP